VRIRSQVRDLAQCSDPGETRSESSPGSREPSHWPPSRWPGGSREAVRQVRSAPGSFDTREIGRTAGTDQEPTPQGGVPLLPRICRRIWLTSNNHQRPKRHQTQSATQAHQLAQCGQAAFTEGWNREQASGLGVVPRSRAPPVGDQIGAVRAPFGSEILPRSPVGKESANSQNTAGLQKRTRRRRWGGRKPDR